MCKVYKLVIPSISFYHAVQQEHNLTDAGKRTVVEDAGVGQQQRDQFGVLVQLHGVLALIGKQSANVDSEVHFIG